MDTAMIEAERPETVYSFVGGDLSLDFTNTVSGWRDIHAFDRDKLISYADLVAWSRQAGILTPDESSELLALSSARPAEAAAALEKAFKLREAIHALFLSTTKEEEPDHADLAEFNETLSAAMSRSRVTHGSEGFAWGWAPEEEGLDRMLWPIARSAADLLTSGDLKMVRSCDGDTCGWLFIDASKNHSRRWCDMRDCGNRAKVHRHYQRKRASGKAG